MADIWALLDNESDFNQLFDHCPTPDELLDHDNLIT